MGYFTWEEDDAYKKGYNDGLYGRRDHFRNEHFGDANDKAYYDGLREAEREEERRRELYEEERRQEEREERRREEHYRYMRELEREQEEQEYYNQFNQSPPTEQNQYDDLPF